MVPFISSPGSGEVKAIWPDTQPVAFAAAVWAGGRFANCVIISTDRVPVGVEMKSNVGVAMKTEAGSIGITKVLIEKTKQNKTMISVEIEADCPRRREEN